VTISLAPDADADADSRQPTADSRQPKVIIDHELPVPVSTFKHIVVEIVSVVGCLIFCSVVL
jgi:hypothetical protein